MRQRLILAIAFAAAAFHLYAAGVAPFTALVQRPIHLALIGTLGFLGLGMSALAGPEGGPARQPRMGRFAEWAGWVLAVVGLVSAGYLAMNHQELVQRSANPTPLDLLFGALTIVVVLELTRRTTGWGLVVISILCIVYAMAGPWMPGILAHRGYDLTRLVETLYLSTEGIWGIPLGVSADFVYLFIVFGVVLEVAGAGALLMALAERVAGNSRGGPAKTAVVASGLMGSLSGSAVANVVTTGTFTIPLMKRAGFKPFFAGAVEAAASTGGQMMPPIMGAGAFILATWTQIPYLEVALAATIPALLYYAALFAAIHFRAAKMGIEPRRMEERDPVLPRLHLLLPLVAIVVLLALGRSPMRAAFWGVTSAFVIALLRPTTRLTFADVKRVVVSAGGATVQVAAACAAAGILVGVTNLTGIGLRMSDLIITLSAGRLFPALVLTAIGSLIIGLGLPTTASYVVLAALGAPALVELGVPILAAHLFIFYFGALSSVTPPVALAGYAAAGLADAPAMKTSNYSMVLALPGFIVPFMMVYGPPLLLQGSVVEIVWATITATIGVTALAAGTMGYARRPLGWWERGFVSIGALALIDPGLVTDAIGFTIILFIFALKDRPELKVTTAPVDEMTMAAGVSNIEASADR